MTLLLLSEAIAVAQSIGVEIRAASDAELLMLWRRRHPHRARLFDRPLPAPERARIIAVAWRSQHDARLHLRYLRAAALNQPGVSRIRLAEAVKELVVALYTRRCPMQLVALDVFREPVVIVEQAPRPRIVRRCELPAVTA